METAKLLKINPSLAIVRFGANLRLTTDKKEIKDFSFIHKTLSEIAQ